MGKEPRRSVRDNLGLTPVNKKETTGRKEKREREGTGYVHLSIPPVFKCNLTFQRSNLLTHRPVLSNADTEF